MPEPQICVFILRSATSSPDITFQSLNENPNVGILLHAIWQLKSVRMSLTEVEIDFSQISLHLLHHSVAMKPWDTVRKRVQDSVCDNGFETLCSEDQVSPLWCDSNNVNIYLCIDKVSAVQAAERLYETIWGKELDVILEEITYEGTTWKYVPKKHIDLLEMSQLGYTEESLLVRAEYEAAVNMFDFEEAMERGCGGVVVTGQPGIGKSSFLFYLLLCLLSQETPVALQLPGYLLVFQNDGVYQHPLTAYSVCLPRGTWALCDSNEEIQHPCSTFCNASGQGLAWIVQTTSPWEDRWKSWEKHYGAQLFIMEHFSIQEMSVLGKILDLDVGNVQHFYKQWGHSARICISLARDPTKEAVQEAAVEQAASYFFEKPTSSSKTSHFLTLLPHTLFPISPKGKTGWKRQVPIADMATDRIKAIVLYAAADGDPRERVRFYHMISHWKEPMFSAFAGKMFETFVLTWLSSDADNLAPLPCTPTAKDGSPSLQIPTCGEEQRSCDSLATLKCMKADKLPFCFLPASQSLTSVDAIIFTDKCIITIQVITMISDDTQAAKLGGIDIISKHLPTLTDGKGQKRLWCHVFITDDEDKARSLRGWTSSDLPDDIHLYSAVFRIDRVGITSENMRRLDEDRRHAEENMVVVDNQSTLVD